MNKHRDKLEKVFNNRKRYYYAVCKHDEKRHKELYGYVCSAWEELLEYDKMIDGIIKLCITGE